jgi:malonyl CoA-acyl carrier protein transacylase
MRALCLEGPIEELTRTEVAQPALFAVSMAMTELAREAGLQPGLRRRAQPRRVHRGVRRRLR